MLYHTTATARRLYAKKWCRVSSSPGLPTLKYREESHYSLDVYSSSSVGSPGARPSGTSHHNGCGTQLGCDQKCHRNSSVHNTILLCLLTGVRYHVPRHGVSAESCTSTIDDRPAARICQHSRADDSSQLDECLVLKMLSLSRSP